MALGISSITGIFNTSAGDKALTVLTNTGFINIGSLYVAIIAASGNNGAVGFGFADDCPDGLGSWSRIVDAQDGTTFHIQMWIRNKKLADASADVTFTASLGTNTGGGLVLFEITGMLREGLQAVLQSGKEQQAAGGTPNSTALLANTPIAGNVALAGVINLTNPSGVATFPSGWTGFFDFGYASPTSGMNEMYTTSPNTAATTFSSTSASNYATICAEFDASAVPPTTPPPPGMITQTAINRAALYCTAVKDGWRRRKSGILVPEYVW